MKITKQKLNKIIKEELEGVLEEGYRPDYRYSRAGMATHALKTKQRKESREMKKKGRADALAGIPKDESITHLAYSRAYDEAAGSQTDVNKDRDKLDALKAKYMKEELEEVFGLKNPFKKKQAAAPKDNSVLAALEQKLKNTTGQRAFEIWNNKDGYDDVRNEIIMLTKYIQQTIERRRDGKRINEMPKLLSNLSLATQQAMRSKEGNKDRDKLDALKAKYMKDVTEEARLQENEFSVDGYYIHEYGSHYDGPFETLELAMAAGENLPPYMSDLEIALFKNGEQVPGTTEYFEESKKMKITKNQLKHIIKEEIDAVLESDDDRAPRGGISPTTTAKPAQSHGQKVVGQAASIIKGVAIRLGPKGIELNYKNVNDQKNAIKQAEAMLQTLVKSDKGSSASYIQQVVGDMIEAGGSLNAAKRGLDAMSVPPRPGGVGSLNRENMDDIVSRLAAVASQLYRVASGEPLQGIVEIKKKKRNITKVSKNQIKQIVREEISNVLEIKYKSGDWSYQSPEREKELEAARVKIQNKMDILATKMDDLEDSLTAPMTDKQVRAYAKLKNQYDEQRRLLVAATPAPPPEPEPEPEKEEDSLGYRMQPDFSAVTDGRDRYAMSSIKALVPREDQAKGEDAISNFIDTVIKNKPDSLLSRHTYNLFNNGNWGLRDVLNPKMWKSIK
jgi:hypothetical protein